MKIKLILTGKTEEPYIREGMAEYSMRVNRYASFEIIELPTRRNQTNSNLQDQKEYEAAMIQKHVRPGDSLILLDERGKEMRSTEFAEFLNKQFLSGSKNLVFATGGAFGFDAGFRSRAAMLLSLSRMTFSHQMVRLFFTEQLYRAMTILRGESYHHE